MMSTLSLSGCDHLNHHFSFSESEEWLKEKSGLYETPLSPVLSSGTHCSISGLGSYKDETCDGLGLVSGFFLLGSWVC